NTTGFAPFFLNHRSMPKSMVWNWALKDEYPGVRAFTQQLKVATMTAHDSILAAQVKQKTVANKQRIPTPFVEGDLVYLSMEN
ncbi:hypothetical protein FA15DRAFT_547213, partial [Coprinopsis marcescibilis]